MVKRVLQGPLANQVTKVHLALLVNPDQPDQEDLLD